MVSAPSLSLVQLLPRAPLILLKLSEAVAACATPGATASNDPSIAATASSRTSQRDARGRGPPGRCAPVVGGRGRPRLAPPRAHRPATIPPPRPPPAAAPASGTPAGGGPR